MNRPIRLSLFFSFAALGLAVSIASLVLTTGAVKRNAPEPAVVQPRNQGAGKSSPSVENQAWRHIANARVTGDQQHYRKALKLAEGLKSSEETRFAGNLLRGHVLHQQHRFAEALEVALDLTATRGMHCDFGLLGDVLLDTGDVDAAIGAYGKQMELRPGLEAYARAAQVRWLKGQTAGAIEAMTMAAGAGSMRNPEPTVWVLSMLALFQFQEGREEAAVGTIDRALEWLPGHPRALAVKARISMGEGDLTGAVEILNELAVKLPEPAVLWMLVDCLRETGDAARAGRIGKGLIHRGVKEDPRTVSLFLATLGQDPSFALSLAKKELESRQDVFTHDAVAWAAHVAGNYELALTHMEAALREGTRDARLFLHAGTIFKAHGDQVRALDFLTQAGELRQMLLPSEAQLLDGALQSLNQNPVQISHKD